MKKLVIVDGSGFLFRAWFAFPPMINAQGNNQNVLYGFTRMLLKLIDETSADYFIIARDSPVKTKRHELYPDYKGTRPKIDDDFKQQIPQVHKLIEELGIAHDDFFLYIFHLQKYIFVLYSPLYEYKYKTIAYC